MSPQSVYMWIRRNKLCSSEATHCIKNTEDKEKSKVEEWLKIPITDINLSSGQKQENSME